jgi:hypothetical protein
MKCSVGMSCENSVNKFDRAKKGSGELLRIRVSVVYENNRGSVFTVQEDQHMLGQQAEEDSL